jgi:hypothetical protein
VVDEVNETRSDTGWIRFIEPWIGNEAGGARDYAFEKLKLKRVISLIHPTTTLATVRRRTR